MTTRRHKEIQKTLILLPSNGHPDFCGSNLVGPSDLDDIGNYCIMVIAINILNLLENAVAKVVPFSD